MENSSEQLECWSAWARDNWGAANRGLRVSEAQGATGPLEHWLMNCHESVAGDEDKSQSSPSPTPDLAGRSVAAPVVLPRGSRALFSG